MDVIGNAKTRFVQLQKKGFNQFVNFSTFNEKEWVRYVLRRIHAKFIWLDQPYKITTDVIRAVTCLNLTGEKPGLRKVTKPIVNKLTGLEFDVRSMKINTIKEDDVKFVAMVIGYKVYQSNRPNSICGTAIHSTYKMVKEDGHYELCSVLLEELMINLKKIKQDKKHVFKFGSLVICLVLYFMNQIPEVGRVQWDFDKLVAQQIK